MNRLQTNELVKNREKEKTMLEKVERERLEACMQKWWQSITGKEQPLHPYGLAFVHGYVAAIERFREACEMMEQHKEAISVDVVDRVQAGIWASGKVAADMACEFVADAAVWQEIADVMSGFVALRQEMADMTEGYVALEDKMTRLEERLKTVEEETAIQ